MLFPIVLRCVGSDVRGQHIRRHLYVRVNRNRDHCTDERAAVFALQICPVDCQ